MVENGTGDDDQVRPLRSVEKPSSGPAWAAPALRSGSDQDAAEEKVELDPAPVQPLPPPPPPSGDMSTQVRDSKRGSRKTLYALGGMSVALLTVLGIAIGAVAGTTADSAETAPLSESINDLSPVDQPIETPAADCTESSSEAEVVGAGKGSRDSGPGVILAFEHAYYVERDAKKMIALTTKDSPIKNAEALQEGIDSNAKGLSHCVRIAATDEGGVWDVEITTSPDDFTETTVISQRITTTKEAGTWSIKSVEEIEE